MAVAVRLQVVQVVVVQVVIFVVLLAKVRVAEIAHTLDSVLKKQLIMS